MQIGLRRCGLLYCIAIIAKLCLGFNVFTYTTEAVESKEKTHALHYKSEFYDYISRTFRLSNGNTVQCQIPIYSTFNQNFLPTLEEEFRSNKANVILQASTQTIADLSEESDVILQSLQNQCTEYRTSKFLWQFCFKKYLRQFDDILTLVDAQKSKFEDIYVGYYNNYDYKTNLTKADYKYEQNNENYFQIDNFYNKEFIEYENKIYKIHPHIVFANASDSTFVSIVGKVVQLQRFNTTLFISQNLLAIEFTTTKQIPKHKLSNTLIELQFQNDTHLYGYRIILHTLIDKHFALAKDELPPDVHIETFEVLVFKGSGRPRNDHFLTMYDGRYIYGKNLNALKQLSKDDLIIVQLYNQVIIKRIKKVWYHSLVELYEDIQGDGLEKQDFYIQSIQIFARYRQYKLDNTSQFLNMFIGIYDSYFEFSRFDRKEKYISGKYLIGFAYLSARVGDTLLFISSDSYVISRIVSINAGVIQLDTRLDNFNGFIMKANSLPSKQTYFDFYPENRNKSENHILLDQDQQSINRNKFVAFKTRQFPRILSFKSIPDEITDDKNLLQFTDLDGFSFSDEEIKKQRFMNFIIQTSLLKETFSQLKLIITDSLERVTQAIEIIFTHDNQILAYDAFNKRNIISKNKRYENTTLSDLTIWILIDTDNNNTLRLGFSNVICPSNQVLSLQTNYTSLRHFRFITQHTVNYYLLFTYLNVIDKPIDFSVLHPNLQSQSNKLIKQTYFNGDLCSVINAPRAFSVDYVCGESFFSIVSVTEPSVCKYHLLVETYLLCQNQVSTYNIPPPPKNIYCILKHSTNK